MNLLLIGYGKMGKTIEKMAIAKGHHIAGIIDISEQAQLNSMLSHTDVAIEFTHPEAAFRNLSQCIRAKVPVVCGTTGWLDRYEEFVEFVKRNDGSFFYASNFSLGVNVFFELNRYLSNLMGSHHSYSPSVEEVHHIHKKDAPSGTAITLAQDIIAETRYEKWSLDATERDNDIPITSIREGSVFGKHTVTWNSPQDQITITHDAHSREGFAAGAILAAEWLLGRQGVFSMKDLLGLSTD